MDVKKIASLSRLQISDAEANQLAQQMKTIFSHFEKISAINTEGVEPMVTPSDIEFCMREDEVKIEISAEEAVQNAPEIQGHLFRVPPVVG